MCFQHIRRKFFGIELGTQSKFEKESDRAIVNGAHSAGDLQKLLDKFIATFVLCPTCKLPEIKMEVLNSRIKIDCAACGHNSIIKTAHKLATYIVKNPPKATKAQKEVTEDEEDKTTKKKKEVKKKTKKKEQKDSDSAEGSKKKPQKGESEEVKQDDEEEEEIQKVSKIEEKIQWFTDTSKEAQIARQEAEFAEMQRVDESMKKNLQNLNLSNAGITKTESPSTILKLFLAGGTKRPDEVLAEVRRLQLARGLDEQQRLKVLFDALFNFQPEQLKTFVQQLTKQIPILKTFAQDKLSRRLMMCCLEDLVGNVQPKLAGQTSVIFQILYEAELLDEESIISWFDSPPESSWLVNKEVAVSIRKKAKPFVDWLRTADEEEA